MDDDEYDSQDRTRSVVMTALVGLALIVVLIAIGTTIFVKALGLDQSGSAGPVDSTAPTAQDPLPTRALTPRNAESTPPANPPKSMLQNPAAAHGPIRLDASPLMVSPMERINLTGTYPGKDNLGLEVQRWEPGGWVNFGVSTTVRVGTFETYVMTGRSGDNRFRVVDPASGKASNPVVVSVG